MKPRAPKTVTAEMLAATSLELAESRKPVRCVACRLPPEFQKAIFVCLDRGDAAPSISAAFAKFGHTISGPSIRKHYVGRHGLAA